MPLEEGPKGIAQFNSGKMLNNRGNFLGGKTQGNRCLEGLKMG